MAAQAEKSRFWAAASSSEGEQGSDSDSFSDVAPAAKAVDRKFAQTYSSDSDSEDEVRVVKSAKDRKWDSMQEVSIARATTRSRLSSALTDYSRLYFLFLRGSREFAMRARTAIGL
jgi:hypothetical protein